MKGLQRGVCVYAWYTVDAPEVFAQGQCACVHLYSPSQRFVWRCLWWDRRVEVHVRINRCVWTEAGESQMGMCHSVGVLGRKEAMLGKAEGGEGENC